MVLVSAAPAERVAQEPLNWEDRFTRVLTEVMELVLILQALPLVGRVAVRGVVMLV